mmetsp:Transcript_13745/g.51403  ORF Transcript_13745/g.51403 Transcript_13745/m.51403 type:complete len:252 (-) Transcript_13745:67-822(-)
MNGESSTRNHLFFARARRVGVVVTRVSDRLLTRRSPVQSRTLLRVFLHLFQDVLRLAKRRFFLFPFLDFGFHVFLRFGAFRLDGFQLVLFFIGHGFDLLRALAFVLLDERDFVLRASLFGRRVARRRVQRFLRERLHRVEIAALLIILALLVASHEVLQRGVPLDPHSLARLFALSGAVHVHDQHGPGVREALAELVPIGSHGLAVASPRCQELDERVLAGIQDVRVERAVRGLNNAFAGGNEREQSQEKH